MLRVLGGQCCNHWKKYLMNFDGNFRYMGCELIAVVELVQESIGDFGRNFCDDENSNSN